MIDQLAVCTSARMRAIRDLVAKVATTNATVLLTGESGVGKEVVARAIHQASPRAHRRFLKLNCAAVPEELLESELFGHQRGAFTGAYRDKRGTFELAGHGTLMLDEIGEVPLRLQAKLLHILQDGEFARVGGERVLQTDVRVLAATNRDLAVEIRAGRFREDLYYRLNVLEIRVPPLRERRDEIPALVHHFLQVANAQYGRRLDIPPATLQMLVDHAWPGNIRELENTVKRLVVLGNMDELSRAVGIPAMSAADVAPNPVAPAATRAAETIGLKTIARQAARAAERTVIAETLERVHWNKAKTARLLQISYKALLYKIVDCGLGDSKRAPQAAV